MYQFSALVRLVRLVLPERIRITCNAEILSLRMDPAGCQHRLQRLRIGTYRPNLPMPPQYIADSRQLLRAGQRRGYASIKKNNNKSPLDVGGVGETTF